MRVDNAACMSNYETAIKVEQDLLTKRIALMQQVKNARLRQFLACKKHSVAEWKACECISKRQRPFLYAHNSIRE